MEKVSLNASLPVAMTRNDQCTMAPITLTIPKDGFDLALDGLDRKGSHNCSMEHQLQSQPYLDTSVVPDTAKPYGPV